MGVITTWLKFKYLKSKSRFFLTLVLGHYFKHCRLIN